MPQNLELVVLLRNHKCPIKEDRSPLNSCAAKVEQINMYKKKWVKS